MCSNNVDGIKEVDVDLGIQNNNQAAENEKRERPRSTTSSML